MSLHAIRYNPIQYAPEFPDLERYRLYFVASKNSPISYANTNSKKYCNCQISYEFPGGVDFSKVILFGFQIMNKFVNLEIIYNKF